MNAFLPKSTTGLVLAFIYIGFTLYVIHDDRRAQGSGFLSGLASRIMVAPVSAIAEGLGSRLNFRSNLQMGFAVLASAVLVYGIGFGLGKIGRIIFARFAV